MGPGVAQTPANDIFSPGVPSLYSVMARRLAEDGYGVMHFSWKVPTPTRADAQVRAPRRVRECADDVQAAAQALRVSHEGASKSNPPLPLVLVGYSSEACAAVMAAATLSVTGAKGKHIGPIAGVVCIAPGLRTNDRQWHYGGCDTLSCLGAMGTAQLPLLLLHGLSDTIIEPESTVLAFNASSGPTAATLIQHADHTLKARFDDVLTLLLGWLPDLVRRYQVVGDAAGQFSVDDDTIFSTLGLGKMATI